MRTMADDGQRIIDVLGGEWGPRGGMTRCPAHADATPSLSIRPGKTRLLFHCFAGCSNEDVLRALAGLRLSSTARVPAAGSSAVPRNLGQAAIRLWHDAGSLVGTLAETYLRSRSINIESPALRFHPRTPFGRKPHTVFAPALIAGVCDDKALIAVQRIFLHHDGSRSLTIDPPKRGLGMPGSGAVRLAVPGRTLGLAEGVETSLSATRLFGIACWATLGTDRIHQIAIPESVETLVLFLDNDASGRRAEQRARDAYGERLTIVPRYPPRVGEDWNDVLRRHMGQAGSG